MLGFAQTGQVRVNGGDDRAAVAEVDLNLAEVLALLQQMRRVGVAQRVDVRLLAEGLFPKELDGADGLGAGLAGHFRWMQYWRMSSGESWSGDLA